MAVITDKKRIAEIFDRGIVVEIFPSKAALMKELLSGRRLKIYIGVDPTSNSLHLSHAKNYIFLEELRQLGHEVIVLFGDFTARIGDPSGRTSSRAPLNEEQIKENMRGWTTQIKPLMDFDAAKNPPRIAYNSKWLAGLSLKDLILLASNFTVQQMLKRDMFEKRLRDDAPIHLHEFLYPLMQGYDSVELDVDAELCGTDQIFNALAGRTLLKRLKNKEKYVIAVNLMENPKTHELMSKSRGTGVFLSSPPEEMYGAIMAQPDEMIEVLYINVTRLPLSEKKELLGLGPRKAKAVVAFEIVKKIYGEVMASRAEEYFDRTFSKKELPENIPALKLSKNKSSALDVVLAAGVKSKSEARRLIEQGAFEFNETAKDNPNEVLSVNDGDVVRIGKKKFFRIKL